MERKHYIDNLRILCIFLLFPFHAANCFNSFGERFYVTGEPNDALSQLIVGIYPWWMSLLFALAGISSLYALRRRSAGEYARERVLRLLVPLIFSLLTIIPAQAYIGDVWNCGYDGGYFEHYGKFFTTLTDWSGYDGGFTPGNLWFILYLFLISVITLPLISFCVKRKSMLRPEKLGIFGIIAVGYFIIAAMSFVLNIGDKCLGEFAACFLLGFFVLSNEKVLEKLKKYCVPLGTAWALLIAARCAMWAFGLPEDSVAWFFEYKALEWIGMLAAIGLGGRFLNVRNGFTSYFASAEFPLYVFHQTILVALAFFVVPAVKNTYLAFTVITAASFALTIAVYELFRRIPATRFMFGIKKPRKEQI